MQAKATVKGTFQSRGEEASCGQAKSPPIRTRARTHARSHSCLERYAEQKGVQLTDEKNCLVGQTETLQARTVRARTEQIVIFLLSLAELVARIVAKDRTKTGRRIIWVHFFIKNLGEGLINM